ncbi:hypothetical protein [Xenophilus sp. Marseille-Q4582]|uniref:hypothetical protein n=1 Tax=Xenophilus sp. Marseille-Q4582 TaxID=2866600 RepID=UPI001CE3FA70|nr:hypothetical protein [Xenophilus sp. Marseille-Q4582]
MAALSRSVISRLLLVSACAWSLAVPAQGMTQMKLFKIVSPRDDIVVGVDAAQLGAGDTPEVQRLATLLADKGQLTLWQYASQKDASGALVQAPLRQVAVFKNELLRIEPYASPLPVKAPGATR